MKERERKRERERGREYQFDIKCLSYFIKMMSSTCDCLIFLYLGMALFSDHVWHTGMPMFSHNCCPVSCENVNKLLG